LPVDVVVAIDRHNANGGNTALAIYIGEQVERAATIDRKTMTAARSAWQQLQQAQEAYAKAVEPIKAAVIPQPSKT
jgi:hypothetical protein